jgi:hypothetical protein
MHNTQDLVFKIGSLLSFFFAGLSIIANKNIGFLFYIPYTVLIIGIMICTLYCIMCIFVKQVKIKTIFLKNKIIIKNNSIYDIAITELAIISNDKHIALEIKIADNLTIPPNWSNDILYNEKIDLINQKYIFVVYFKYKDTNYKETRQLTKNEVNILKKYE